MYCGVEVGLAVTPGDHAAACGVAPLPSTGGAYCAGMGGIPEAEGLPFVAGLPFNGEGAAELPFFDDEGAAGLLFFDDDGAEPVFFLVGVVGVEAGPLPLPLPEGGGGEEPPAVDMLKRHGQQELEVGSGSWF
jgi:hypothetical protein